MSKIERTVEYCQYRIQQAIGLCDDEIDRLGERLNEYKSQIIEVKERIVLTEREIAEAVELKQGREKRKKTGRMVALARMQSQCHQRTHDLQEKQAKEIEDMQRSFEDTLQELTKTEEEKLMGSQALMDTEIARVRAMTEKYEIEVETIVETKTAEENEVNEDVDEISQSVIADLQHLLDSRTQERLENLRESKGKLSKCVDAIDSLARAHTLRLQDVQERIAAVESEYAKNIEAVRGTHEKVTRNMKEKLADTEKSAESLVRASRKLEKSNRANIRETMAAMETREPKPIAGLAEEEAAQTEHVRSLRKEIGELRKTLAQKEAGLHAKRSENEKLKREIGRLKHDISFAGRLKH